MEISQVGSYYVADNRRHYAYPRISKIEIWQQTPTRTRICYRKPGTPPKIYNIALPHVAYVFTNTLGYGRLTTGLNPIHGLYWHMHVFALRKPLGHSLDASNLPFCRLPVHNLYEDGLPCAGHRLRKALSDFGVQVDLDTETVTELASLFWASGFNNDVLPSAAPRPLRWAWHTSVFSHDWSTYYRSWARHSQRRITRLHWARVHTSVGVFIGEDGNNALIAQSLSALQASLL